MISDFRISRKRLSPSATIPERANTHIKKPIKQAIKLDIAGRSNFADEFWSCLIKMGCILFSLCYTKSPDEISLGPNDSDDAEAILMQQGPAVISSLAVIKLQSLLARRKQWTVKSGFSVWDKEEIFDENKYPIR
jgi:hypothetical protein